MTVYEKDEAIVLPKDAVHREEDDEDIRYVWIVDPDDADKKPEKRNVEVGRSTDEDLEILSGIELGEVVSLDDEEEADEQ